MTQLGAVGTVDAFNVMKDHIGHEISFNEFKEENVIVGVEVYCDTCQERIFLKETYSYAVREQVESNRAIRMGAQSFDEWKDNFILTNGDVYEDSELSDLYDEYIRELQRDEPITQPWDTGQTPARARTYTTPSYATRNRVVENGETGWSGDTQENTDGWGTGEDGWTT